MTFIKNNIRWILAIWIAFVFVQSLFFKFAGSPETEHIFGTLGQTFNFPWFARYGGYTIGGVELIASAMLFTRVWPFAACLSFGIMSGAILFHLFTPLGIVMPAFDAAGMQVGDDGGTLFIMACITWCCALTLMVKDWRSDASQVRSFVLRR